MKNKGQKKSDRFLLVCALAFFIALFIDLATKAWAEYYFTYVDRNTVTFIPHFMNLTLHYNSGMAFSMFADNEIAMNIITVVSVVVMIGLVILVIKLPPRFNHYRFIVSVITAGALGNFLDRVLIEDGVRDFMDVSSIGFGVCNFADYFISFGGVILVFCLLFVGEDSIFPVFGKKRKKKQGEEKAEEPREQDGGEE